jgi:predicted ester cyclase
MAGTDLATLYCRFVDSVVNHRRLDQLDRYLAPEVIEHAPDRTVGLGATRRALTGWLGAVPNAHLVIEDLVVEGDHLIARLTVTGTRHDSAAGRAPLSVAMFESWTVRDGRCVERWLLVDRGACASLPAGGAGPNGRHHAAD